MAAMRTGNDDIQLLRALCQTIDVTMRLRACRLLESYAWAEGEHRVVFEVCARLTRLKVPIRRDMLAAQVTREGFPDIDLDALFAPLPSARDELARRIDALAGPEGQQP